MGLDDSVGIFTTPNLVSWATKIPIQLLHRRSAPATERHIGQRLSNHFLVITNTIPSPRVDDTVGGARIISGGPSHNCWVQIGTIGKSLNVEGQTGAAVNLPLKLGANITTTSNPLFPVNTLRSRRAARHRISHLRQCGAYRVCDSWRVSRLRQLQSQLSRCLTGLT